MLRDSRIEKAGGAAPLDAPHALEAVVSAPSALECGQRLLLTAQIDWELLWRMVDAQAGYLKLGLRQAANSCGVSVSQLAGSNTLDMRQLGSVCSWLHLPVDTFFHRDLTSPAQRNFRDLVETYVLPESIQRRLDARSGCEQPNS